MLDHDLLISVCTIIEGAPRVDARGLSPSSDLPCCALCCGKVSQLDLNPLFQSSILFATFYPISTTLSHQPLGDSLMYTPSYVPSFILQRI